MCSQFTTTTVVIYSSRTLNNEHCVHYTHKIIVCIDFYCCSKLYYYSICLFLCFWNFHFALSFRFIFVSTIDQEKIMRIINIKSSFFFWIYNFTISFVGIAQNSLWAAGFVAYAWISIYYATLILISYFSSSLAIFVSEKNSIDDIGIFFRQENVFPSHSMLSLLSSFVI